MDRQSQTVDITVEKDGQDKHEPADEVALRVYLDDEMLNLDESVRVVRNGKQVFEGIVQRRVDVMMQSLAERGDPCYIFPGVIAIPKGSGAEESNEQKLMKLFPENLSAQALMRADKEQRRSLAAVLYRAGDNRNELLEMLRSVKDEHVKAAVFLVMNMPDRDIVRLTRVRMNRLRLVMLHVRGCPFCWPIAAAVSAFLPVW